MKTLRMSIPHSWIARTRVLVHEAEAYAYRTAWPAFDVWTHHADHIGGARQAAVEACEDDRLVLLDDDLQFYVRRQYDPPRLRNAEPRDLEQLWAATEHLLGPDLPLIGVSFRQHNDATPGAYSYNGRVDRAYAMHLPTLRKVGFRFELALMENFDLTLTLLRAGYPDMIWWHWAQGQETSNASGGCSIYRTAEAQAEAAKKLASRHAPFVKVVTGKTTKTSWAGIGEREDVICEWGEAYDLGRRLRGVNPPELNLRGWLPEEALSGGQPSLF